MAKLGHVITDADGAFESWSENAAAVDRRRSFTTPRSTRDWLDMLHPDDRERFRSASIEAAVKEPCRRRIPAAAARRRVDAHPPSHRATARGIGCSRACTLVQHPAGRDEERKAETRIIRLKPRLRRAKAASTRSLSGYAIEGSCSRKACRIAVQAGQFPVAFVAVADPRDQRVKAVALGRRRVRIRRSSRGRRPARRGKVRQG